MSERLFKFFLHELTTVRIVCRKDGCGSVSEVSIKKLQSGKSTLACPGCGQNLRVGGAPPDDLFAKLGKAIADITDQKANFEVEFVLPESGQRG